MGGNTMLVSKEVANKELLKLSPQNRQNVNTVMIDVRNKYIMNKIQIDIPCYFWMVNKPIFFKDEEIDFLEIVDPEVFAINAIYLISRYMNTHKG